MALWTLHVVMFLVVLAQVKLVHALATVMTQANVQVMFVYPLAIVVLVRAIANVLREEAVSQVNVKHQVQFAPQV